MTAEIKMHFYGCMMGHFSATCLNLDPPLTAHGLPRFNDGDDVDVKYMTFVTKNNFPVTQLLAKESKRTKKQKYLYVLTLSTVAQNECLL